MSKQEQENNSQEQEQQEQQNTKDEDIDISELKQKLDKQQEFIDNINQEKEVNQAIADIQTRDKNFDVSKVQEYLEKINQTDPQRADELNSPLGWEWVWNQIKPKEVLNDDYDYNSVRRGSSIDEQKAMLEKVNSGEFLSVDDELKIIGDLI